MRRVFRCSKSIINNILILQNAPSYKQKDAETIQMVRGNHIRYFAESHQAPGDKCKQPSEGKMVSNRLQKFMKDFYLSQSEIKEIYNKLDFEIKKGLKADTNKDADIKCYLTYVHNLPTGNEKGKVIALDLGGTNFRVLLVELLGPNKATVKSTIYAIPTEIMTGTGEKLFDHIAECVAVFLKDNNMQGSHRPLGFTFSFPCTQLSIDKALLKTWTKGYSASGVPGTDIGEWFTKAISKRKDVQIRLVAILNDTTGTLMSCAYRQKDCRIGIIVGTGCNSCYVEKTENAELLDEEYKCEYDHVIINTEWGAFGSNGCLDFIRTLYDYRLDADSLNRGKQIYEKMISGMYLGGLVRRALVGAVQNDFFNVKDKEKVLKKLCIRSTFHTRYISDVEGDKFPDFKNAKAVLKEFLFLENPSLEECLALKYICESICRRAAILVGIGVSVLINKVDQNPVTVGIDGTLYRKHPKFYLYMGAALKLLIPPEKKYQIMVSHDGSGLGAAVVAAVVDARLKKQKQEGKKP